MYYETMGENMPVVMVNGNHVELETVFSSGGTAINVSGATFELHRESETGTTVSIPSGSLLVPFSKYGSGTGRYRVSFLADDWLDDGTYYGIMSGTVSGAPIQAVGVLTARAASGIQGLIEMVRSALHDFDGNLYAIEDSEQFLFKDGQLYDSLIRALNKINYTRPSDYTFTLTGCPWTGLLIDGAVIYALHQRGILEVANTLQYNDEISFTIDRSQKYITMLQVFASNWETNVMRVKTQYAFSRAGQIGMGQTRIPYAITRIFSFIPTVGGMLGYGSS